MWDVDRRSGERDPVHTDEATQVAVYERIRKRSKYIKLASSFYSNLYNIIRGES